VGYTPDGKTIVTGSKDTLLKLWDASTGVLITTVRGHPNRIESIACSPDGKFIVTGGGGGDTLVRVWMKDAL
jgi:WD40 repeat protein